MRLLAAALVWCIACVASATLAAPAEAHEAGAAPITMTTLTATTLTATIERGGTDLRAVTAELERDLAAPGAVRTVASWWSGLGGGARDRLEQAAPSVIGNLDGVPFSVRARVNRERLSVAVSAVRAAAQHASGIDAIAVGAELATLRAISDSLRHRPGEPDRSLITFDTTGATLAAIAIGDVDTATDVSFLVPGMLYTVAGQLVDWTDAADRLYRSQRASLQRLGVHGRSVATVAWLGYQTPGLIGALSLTRARQGAERLQSVLRGLRAIRGADQPFLSVIAHSYGSTVALLALQSGAVSVDALALLGSPGGEAVSAQALDVPVGNVYVGAATLDPIALCGFFGASPDSPQFGARRMPLTGGTDPLDGARMLPSFGHNDYFAAGTESLRNLALIGIDHGSLIGDTQAR